MTEHATAAAFRGTVYHGESIQWESDSWTFKATVRHDDDSTPPWERWEGSGPVTDWTAEPAGDGQRELCRDGRHCRFYGWTEALAIAVRDGWSAPPHDEGTAEERAARAVAADFERLRAWCHDEWSYVGVVVTAAKAGVVLASESLWGIESDCSDYVTETARELAAQAKAAAERKLTELCSHSAA